MISLKINGGGVERVRNQSDRYEDILVRLPLYYELTLKKQNKIINLINNLI